MSGGKLVVLDRAGRDAKRYVLAEGLATLGSDLACNIRLMLPTVSPHHATVVVHAHQTVVHSVSEGETLVNGVPVSVAALHHEDIISLGGRHLRWEYSQPHLHRPLSKQTQPALVSSTSRGRGRARCRGRSSDPVYSDPIHHPHRASMPASTSMKQVAIVQPQRRDISQGGQPSRIPVVSIARRQDLDNTTEHSDANTTQEIATRKSSRPNPKSPQASTTKASQWIESRKSNTRPSVTPCSSRPQSTARARPALTPIPSRSLPPRSKSVSLRTTITPMPSRSLPARSKSVSLRPALTPIPSRSLPARSKSVSLRTPLTPMPSRSLPARSKSVSLRPTLTPMPSRSLPARSKSIALRPTLTPLQTRTQSLRVTVTPSRASRATRTVSGPRRDTSLRSTVLRRTHNRPVKIEAPTSIDHTKQAAIMLMTRHTKSKSPTAPVSLVVTKASPVKMPKTSLSPKRSSSQGSRKTSGGRSTSVINITNSEVSVRRSSSCPSTRKSVMKSALKDPKSLRKMESIKFDLSNLENENRASDVVTIDTTNQSYDSMSDISLRYSDSNDKSPSPRRSIHSRSSRIIEKTLGSPMTHTESSESPVTSSPRSRTSRGSIIVQKALVQSDMSKTRSSKSMSESLNDVNKTRTLSPRASNLENYSIVDLVLMDSTATEFNSLDSTPFGTPRSNSRKTRSIDATLLSSTPYKLPQKKISLSDSKVSVRSSSMITPENSENSKPFLSTRVSKASRSRSRINDSDVLLLEEEDSPRTSKRTTKSSASPFVPKSLSINITKLNASHIRDGTITPENVPNNEEVGTPVLNIQSLLDSSRGSFASQKSRTRSQLINKRKTIGVIRSKRKRGGVRSKSLNVVSSRVGETEEGTVTPTGTVALEHEGVKNKHSTAKKTLSKRSMIDDLNESDIVKQLFNSPVKRKLSRSMTEFSRHLVDDDDIPKKLTRNTIAVAGRTPDDSFADRTQAVTPEIFVSPLSTPSNSPNLDGVKRLFAKNTPENNLSDVRGVRRLLRSPQNRKSVKNDLTNVSGVKATFAISPKNRLSDVRVKELFQSSPKNDLRRVSGVKRIFKSTKRQKTPKNSLEDLRGVKNLFRRSPRNDLANASGVKDALQIRSPNNDLTNVRGVRRMFRLEKEQFQSDVSGIKELFNDNNALDSTFDTLMGRPPLRTYAKAATSQKSRSKQKTRQTKSMHDSIDLITTDVEQWLRQRKTVQVYSEHTLPIKKRSLVNSGNEKPRLPIKKRAVHSTPMKGHVTLNVSELGRVSPISAATKARADVTAGTSQLKDSTIQETTTLGANKRRKTKNTTHETESIDEARPRKTRSALKTTLNITNNLTTAESTSGVQLKSPKLAQSTENNEEKVQEKPATTRTRGKRAKQTVLQDTQSTEELQDTQTKDNKSQTKDLQESQTNTRSTRRKVAEKPQTSAVTVKIVTPVKSTRKTRGTKTKSPVQVKNKPKNTTQRRSSLVIHKKPPVVLPASVKKTRQRKVKENLEVAPEVKQDLQTKAIPTRQKAVAKSQTKLLTAVASPVQAARKTRGPKAKQSPVQPKTTKSLANVTKRRTSLVIHKKTPVQKAPAKNSRKKANELDNTLGLQESQTTARSTRQKPAQKPLTPKVRGKTQKTVKNVSPKVETKSKKARGVPVAEVKETTTKAKEAVTRTKRSQKQPEKPLEIIPEKSQRGRKTVAVQPHDDTAAKRRRKNPVDEDIPKTNKVKETKIENKGKGKVQNQSVEVKKTRGKNAGGTPPSVIGVETKKKTEVKATKGKKTAPVQTSAARKRKSVDITSSDKETSGAKRRKAAPAPASASAPARVTRAKIAQAPQESTRARRR